MTQHVPFVFDGWAPLVHTVVVGALSYLLLVVLLRTTGKKSMARMNVFDSVFAVALGSALSIAVMDSTVTLANGLTAFIVLIGLQLMLRYLTRVSKRLEEFINGNPQMLFRNGKFLERAMSKEATTEEEILQAIRQQGILSLDDVAAVVLETDGKFSVIRKSPTAGKTSLADVIGEPKE